MFFLGLDVGTQGVRAIVCDEKGKVFARSSRPLVSDGKEKLPEGWAEQDAHSWWEGASSCLQEVVVALKEEGIAPEEIKAVSVVSTPGTIVPLGAGNEPLRTAIMSTENRAVEEVGLANEAGERVTAKLGHSFKPSFSLSKLLWIKRKEPKIYSLTKRFLHATDFIVGKLTGDYSTTDSSNAFQTGYDPADKRWSGFLSRALEVPSCLLPEVVSPGTIIGPLSPECARETGLSRRTVVAAGMTDGMASLISTGAVSPGEWASIVGTTLAIRGVSEKLVKDREGRICCHPHPEGFWLPGGASSTGGECLKERFGEDDRTELDKYVAERTPTHLTVYPLVQTGERLPFVNPEAEGFFIGRPRDKYEQIGRAHV